ncbi:site-specific integrase [Roseateles koreensis]|uniref:Integrase n=1 Tax=Roseateles koreensis TaxID=2987526 RepID=A0ABT5KTI6_9BURK|nr:hypothetical protein [Roseateles koreensis]MDC8786239.1 hypothetical protein [Roseateles koreensis]
MSKTYDNPDQKLTVPKHFYKPANSSCWYVRLVPPKHVQHVVGVRPFRITTGHSNLKKAEEVGFKLIGAKLSEWSMLAELSAPSEAKPTVLTETIIDGICSARLYAWMKSDEEDRETGLTEEELQNLEEFCRHTDTSMRAALAQGPASAHWPDLVDRVLTWARDIGFELSPTDTFMPTLMRRFAQVERKASEGMRLRNKGDDCSTPSPPAAAFNTLSSVTDAYLAHKAVNGRTKHIDTTLNAWRLFIDYVGDVQFDTIKSAHIFEFMLARMHAEKKPWSEERARNFGKRSLREIFGLARTKGLMTIPNPVDSLEVFPSLSKATESSRKKPRHPFTSAQLNTLFSSEWYDPNESQLFRGKMRTDLGARYWIPLISLCHGNRVSEAAQLVVSDFDDRAGLLVLSFRVEIDSEDDEDKAEPVNAEKGLSAEEIELERLRRLKNKHTERTVPVHPLLTDLGFAEFIESRRSESGNQALLFPSSLPEPGSKAPKLGRAYEQSFLRFVRDKLCFGNGYGNHSFRHQLEDHLRETQSKSGLWPAGMSQQYSGRKKTRPVDRDFVLSEGSEALYGGGYQPAAMMPFVSRLDFSGITPPLPYDEWLQGKPKTDPK